MKLKRVKDYLVLNPGALAIILFQILVLAGAFLLILGNSVLADDDAVFAYCFLVVGIVLQTAKYVRENRWGVSLLERQG
jgi:hypothetical protein